MKLLKWLDENLEKYICMILFMSFTAIMILNVIMRFAVGNAIPWASDLVLFIFVWFVWFSISYAFKEDCHVRVEFITNFFPKKLKYFIEILCSLMILANFGFLLIVGIELLGHSSVVGKTGLLIKYPMWSLYLATPVGITLSLVRLTQNILRKFIEIKKQSFSKEEVEEIATEIEINNI